MLFFLFSNNQDSKWSTWSQLCKAADDGSKELVCDFTKDRYFGGGWKTWEEPQVPKFASGVDHFALMAKVAKGFGVAQLGVRFTAVNADKDKGIEEKAGE